jgi:hypothetical protein
MKNKAQQIKQWMLPVLLATMVPLMMGCPELINYDLGFTVGFADDTKYGEGFEDSIEVDEENEEIRYMGHLLPFLEDDSYEAGLYDGQWEAYNDGYFDAYLEAFDTGFADGYLAAYAPDWEDFLLNDVHLEWEDGSYRDGYNDGYSEGRILGADDFAVGFPSDPDDALAFYTEGNDIYIDALDLGTGEYGPVILYEWGSTPAALNVVKATQPQRKSVSAMGNDKRRSVRSAPLKAVN